MRIGRLFEPLLILGNGEEVYPLLALCDLCGRVERYTSRGVKAKLTRTMGVTNSTKKFGIFNKDGKKWSKKLMRSPLICEPS
jgi:hypothetical protein